MTDSVTYGVNFPSPLNDIAYFHVANNQLPQDVMHILLEGVVPYTMKLILQSFIRRKKFLSLQYLNDKISCFKYSRMESRDKPSLLLPRMLDDENSFHQAGKW